MPPTDHHGSFLTRISIRRNQVTAVDPNSDHELEDLDLFQKHISDRFSSLYPTSDQDSESEPESESFLSISWLRNLLDVYLCCESEFKAVLVSGRDPVQFGKPPLDRLLPEYLDRTVKAMDVCNAVSYGVEMVSHWRRLVGIAVEALEQRPVVEGHVRRAKRALTTVLAAMGGGDEKEMSVFAGKAAERMWSIGRRSGGGGGAVAAAVVNHDRKISATRSFSFCFSKSWSASKQIQAMSANLVAPRGGESTGLALPVYAMSSVLVFVMWALVAAVPCQERAGLGTHFQLPRHLVWAHPILSLQDKIGDEWKKKEKKGPAGLLAEIQVIEKVGRSLVEFCDGFEFPVGEEKMEEVAALVAEMAEMCRRMEVGLGPLGLQVREVFHRMVRSRAEVLDVMEHVGKINTPVPY